MTTISYRAPAPFTPGTAAAAFPPKASAVVGDLVTLPGMTTTRRRMRWVVERCALETSLMLACLSCRQALANECQQKLHLELHPGQTHVLARQCGEHGWETVDVR